MAQRGSSVWLGILVRKLLQRGSFPSVDDLKTKILAFIYDTTTCTFAIDEDDEDELRRFGRPKDGAWAPRGAWWPSPSPAKGCRCASIGVSWKHDGCHYGRALSKDDLRGWKLGRAHIARRLLRMHSEANRNDDTLIHAAEKLATFRAVRKH